MLTIVKFHLIAINVQLAVWKKVTWNSTLNEIKHKKQYMYHFDLVLVEIANNKT